MTIKCLIVDDEPLARRLLESHLTKVPVLSLVSSCSDALEAMEILRREKIDLLFLDVQMPGINGIDFLKVLTEPPKVILTTAFREFALEAFDLDVIDYLLKPISLHRFLKGVNKYLQINQMKPTTNPSTTQEDILLIRVDRKMVRLQPDDIYYIESLKDYVKIHTAKKTFITKESLSSMEEKLKALGFIRIHRSFLVALDRVEAFNNEFVEIIGQQLPYGRTYKEQALSRLEGPGK